MTKLRRLSILISLSTLLVSCNSETAVVDRTASPVDASLVFVLIGDTTDHGAKPGAPLAETIAPGVRSNVESIRDFAGEIARNTGMTLKLQEVTSNPAATVDPFNCRDIDATLRSVRSGKNDTVFIYYSGHGFNLGPDTKPLLRQSIVVPDGVNMPPSQMPYMYCGSYGANPNAEDAARWASTSNPRLVIVMFDSCNSFVPGTGPGPQPAGAPAPPAADLRLISLFLNAKGQVVMAGSEIGTYSFYVASGGMFTQRFLKILDNMPPGKVATWSQVRSEFQKPPKMTANFEGSTYNQVPIIEIR